MYAIFQNGGKQYQVNVGQIVRLEKLDCDVGGRYEFDKVAMIAVGVNDLYIGNPFLVSCSVVGEVIKHGRSSKVLIVKFRRRKHFRKFQGHRQWFTDVKICNINLY